MSPGALIAQFAEHNEKSLVKKAAVLLVVLVVVVVVVVVVVRGGGVGVEVTVVIVIVTDGISVLSCSREFKETRSRGKSWGR